jgi:hypothetical protein
MIVLEFEAWDLVQSRDVAWMEVTVSMHEADRQNLMVVDLYRSRKQPCYCCVALNSCWLSPGSESSH